MLVVTPTITSVAARCGIAEPEAIVVGRRWTVLWTMISLHTIAERECLRPTKQYARSHTHVEMEPWCHRSRTRSGVFYRSGFSMSMLMTTASASKGIAGAKWRVSGGEGGLEGLVGDDVVETSLQSGPVGFDLGFTTLGGRTLRILSDFPYGEWIFSVWLPGDDQRLPVFDIEGPLQRTERLDRQRGQADGH
ncbi:hypothetical protein ACFWGI_08020 [Streptomyces niveus]|uniref:hypothetical protein n=1 Tax=Streptomyces niveus TaxID=193462 RepID=UPI0036679513